MRSGKEVRSLWRRKAENPPREEKAVRAAREEKAEAEVVASPTGTEASRRLCEQIASISGGRCFLGFSRGKDSIAAWLFLREFFDTIIPFHCASVPHLSFVDESIGYFERKFETKIYRCLGGETSTAIQNLIYQPLEDEEGIDALELLKYDNHDIVALLREKYGADVWCAFGINMSDSIDRRIYVKKYQGRNDGHKTFYPCFDWSKYQIMLAIDRAGIVLPGDYRLAARSLAGIPNIRHLQRMEEIYPRDMERIELWFPFIRAQLARNEFRREKFQASRERERAESGGGCEEPSPTGR
jgi:hypothetical protein